MNDCRMDKMPVSAQSFEHKEVPLYQLAPRTYRQELGAQEIFDSGGALVTGPAGTGKSYLLHKLKELEPDTIVCAYTGAAARLIGGSTVAHVLLAQKRGASGSLWMKSRSFLWTPLETWLVSSCAVPNS